MFNTALTSVRHLSLSWASPIQSICSHPTSWRSILILSTHLCLGLPSGSFRVYRQKYQMGFNQASNTSIQQTVRSVPTGQVYVNNIVLSLKYSGAVTDVFRPFTDHLTQQTRVFLGKQILVHQTVTGFSMSWNLTVRYHVYNSLLLVCILRQTNPVHALPSYFCMINFNIILPFMAMSFKWSLSFRFPNQTQYIFLSFPCVPHALSTSPSFI